MKLFTQYTMPRPKTDITSILQKAIDESSKSADGSIVEVNYQGTLFIDKVVLRSHLHLVIPSGCVLKGSGNTENYYRRPGPFERLKAEGCLHALIYGENVVDVTIDGGGTVDGNYRQFILPKQIDTGSLKTVGYPRPEMIYCQGGVGLTLQNITFRDSPFWTVHLLGCEDTTISGVSIINDRRMPNTDGIDVDRSRHTRISNSYISTGDDAIVPKCTEETSQFGACTDLKVSNCVLSSASAAVKIGSNSFGNFAHFEFSHLFVTNSNRGLAIQLRDGGNVDDVTFSDCIIQTKRFSPNWWGRAEPIYITIARRDKDSILSSIHSVRFNNIKCEAENSIFVSTPEASLMSNIDMNSVELIMRQSTVAKPGEFDLRPTCDEEFYEDGSSPVVLNNFSFKNNEEKIIVSDPASVFAKGQFE